MQHSNFFFKYRGVLVSLPLIFGIFCFHGETENYLMWIIGSVFFLSGLLIRIWAQQHLHFRLKMPVAFTRTGPYAFVRNPIYVGNTLICVGLTFFSELFWLVPVTLAWCAALYTLVIQEEELRLLKQYGSEYENYCREVPRWFPRWQATRLTLTNKFLIPSVWSELHNFFYILPFIIKELVQKFVFI